VEPFSNAGPPPQGGKSTGFWLAIVAGVLAVVAMVTACGIFAVTRVIGELDDATDQQRAAASPSPVPSAEPSPVDDGPCRWGIGPDSGVKSVGRPPGTPTGGGTVTIASSIGPLQFRLDPKAPCSALSFKFLAGKKYFDGTRCHRMTNEGLYVLQCGDPTGTGSGGPGYEFQSENLPTGSANPYPACTLAMANIRTPDSNGSQFFIVYRDSQLGPDYTVLGTVTQGLDAIRAAAAAGHDGSLDPSPGGGKPKKEVLLQTVTAS